MNGLFCREDATPRPFRRALAALLLSAATLASGAAAATYRIVELPPPPHASFYFPFTGINEAGAIVGSAALAVPPYGTHAIAWSGPPDYTPRWLPDSHAVVSSANGINDAGIIVGSAFFAWATSDHAVMWGRNGALIRLGEPPGANSSNAWDINNRGTVIGYTGVSPAIWLRPSVPQPFGNFGGEGEPYLDLEALNDSGTLAGSIARSWRADGQLFRWTPGIGIEELHRPLGSETSGEISGVNEAGQVVGTLSINGRNTFFAVMWDVDGSMLVVAPEADYGSDPKINDAGEVVGNCNCFGSGGGFEAFRWTAASGLQRIADLIDPLDPLYPQIASGAPIWAGDINDAGVIAGILDPYGASIPIVLVPQP